MFSLEEKVQVLEGDWMDIEGPVHPVTGAPRSESIRRYPRGVGSRVAGRTGKIVQVAEGPYGSRYGASYLVDFGHFQSWLPESALVGM